IRDDEEWLALTESKAPPLVQNRRGRRVDPEAVMAPARRRTSRADGDTATIGQLAGEMFDVSRNRILWNGTTLQCRLPPNPREVLKAMGANESIELSTVMNQKSGLVWKKHPTKRNLGLIDSCLHDLNGLLQT